MNDTHFAAVSNRNKNRVETLGNVIGGSSYFGACFWCGTQFVSTSDRLVRIGTLRACVRCATSAKDLKAAVARYPALAPTVSAL